MERNAVKLYPTGEYDVIDLGVDDLKTFYREIGCTYVDVVRISQANGQHIDMWIDDEGAIVQGPKINYSANMLLSKNGVRTNGYVHGIVIFATADDEGETAGLPPAELKAIVAQLDAYRPDAHKFYTEHYPE